MIQRYYLLLLFFGLLFLNSCDWNKNNKILDLSSINVDLEIDRYDHQFFAVDTSDLIPSLKNLRKVDSIFFDFYTIQMMRFGRTTDTISPVTKSIEKFLMNKNVLELKDSVDNTFNDLTPLTNELTEAFRYFKHYFPEKKLPKVHTVISEFGYNAVTLDSSRLVFGLDMYLGKDFKYYGSFDFPNYIVKRFEKEFMVPNAMEVLYLQYFAKENNEATIALVHAMIENGKKLYFLECMTPEKEKHVLIGYSKEQLEWCIESEADIWAFYNEHDLFYSKRYMEHKKHVSDGPRTSGMPNEAPGNVGSWVGWQIVNSYMNKSNGTISLKELLATDSEVIMKKSQYKPK